MTPGACGAWDTLAMRGIGPVLLLLAACAPREAPVHPMVPFDAAPRPLRRFHERFGWSEVGPRGTGPEPAGA